MWLQPTGAVIGTVKYGLIIEHKGNNSYDTTWTRNYFISEFDIGDLDGDGLTEIVTDTSTGNDEWLRIFESPALDSFPTSLVWGYDHPDYDEVNWITISNDLDQDGKKEFLWNYLGRVHIVECTGDNSYQEVWTDTARMNGKMLCGDFDCDGKRDFVGTSTSIPRIRVVENTVVGADSYAIVWGTPGGLGDTMVYDNAYMIAQAKDMDGDGKPEFIVGSKRIGIDDSLEFAVFEMNGDNSYHKVWRVRPQKGNNRGISVGDVDGDGKEEMVFSTSGGRLYMYKNNGPDSYELMWQYSTGLDAAPTLIYDLNSNGYKELVYSGYKDYPESTHHETHILEIVGETDFVSLSADSGDKFVCLGWTSAQEIANTAWWIERSTQPDTNFIRIATLPDTQGTRYDTTNYTYVDTTVTNGIIYYYRVADVPLNGAPVWHGPVSATPYLVGLAVTFAGMNLTASSDGVNLTWRTESEQDCYQWEIERSDSPEQGFVQVGKVDGGGTTNQPQSYSYADNTIAEKGEYYYRLAEVDRNGNKTYHGPMSITFGGDVPEAYLLAQSVPNPTRGGVSISFALKKSGNTSLKIYNIAGQVVRILDNGYRIAGVYSIPWDGKDEQGNKVSNGIYLYRLVSGEFQATKKITVLR
ncbi:VCBS repeat-containing protein [candidate division TA06 bacterium]|uniref:VCBS repeat-containing protein n=1 Tax=candidate division TA06 bacterium TaxID=2250710 RepID=A0A933MK27_UNCT6|nr:VCBS repeat-containing protein [candidate division TA06 bacterium]